MFTHLTRVALACALTAAAGTLCAAELRSADVHQSDDFPTVAAVRHMGELLNKQSGGKLSVKVFNKGALGSEKETLDQLKIGALDMTRVNISALNALCPKTLVPSLPFVFRSVEHMRKALDGPAGAEILQSCQSQGFVGLAFYDSGARSIYANKAVKTPEDTKGMKIRVPQSDLPVALVTALGAKASPMPINEVEAALKAGLIDAAENNLPSYDVFKHHQAAKFYSRTEHTMAPELLMMSKVVFDKLSKADQDMLMKAARESVEFQRKKWDEQEAKSTAALKAAGAEFVSVDKAAFQKVMLPVHERFMNTPDLNRLLKAVQDVK
jgi:tripartite ATP-independent transporter DctP family solute receptor